MSIVIKGFGRIGRHIFRMAKEKNLVVSKIIDPNMNVHNALILIKYDSVYGVFPYEITIKNNKLFFPDTNMSIEFINTKTISEIDVAQDTYIIDASSEHKYEEYAAILDANPDMRIIRTQHEKKCDQIIIFGANEHTLKKDSRFIATSICDGVAIVPVLKQINELFTVTDASIISLHPYLANQKLLDGTTEKDISCLSLMRAAPDTLIPKPTSSGKVCMDFFPSLTNKVVAYQMRTPTSCVSSAFIDIDVDTDIKEEDKKRFLSSLDTSIVAINEEPLVSRDFLKNTHSSILDMRRFEMQNKKIRLLIWYDNEYGYSARVVDLIEYINKRFKE